MAENYYESSVKKENQIEYADNIYLSKNILNNRENALNYFYTSPFYTSKSHMSLNEKIRIGKNIDDEEEGYLFDITYDNLSVLKINQPSDIVSLHIYYNANAIFHISLTHKYKLKNISYKKVIQMFCIFNGKIYSSRSFGELLTNKINNIVRNIEKCYDCVDNMMNFNITSNYYFEAKEDNSQLDEVYRNYRLNDVHISTKKKQKRLHT
ncbi:mediator of RNA polymerase II transcription subunit 6, putative [Plasmodium ovale wallikeri]|uniref:Mediator of RNA polymerase II transcription subunit 6 n=2 Tax=Plasmodium ovale TaxID=36330 RepID=A0A1A8ZD52_PLAOA|nr:mediator of RNA polymerase II transcription subunit 6, putative [Plasmodium ovale wallikeri]SBT42172.1 mediator of RNA polymerase II transcription subunit 6, putative [Plasmodium ovale wallikeri]SBT78246.1 mediator of RNA polymerase II transcription subunit 6, putative [Plasmodium ovale]